MFIFSINMLRDLRTCVIKAASHMLYNPEYLFPVFNMLKDYIHKKENSVAFSMQANYTDSATATGRRILVPTLADKEVSRGQRDAEPPRPLISVF
jgi:hypothetical protein